MEVDGGRTDSDGSFFGLRQRCSMDRQTLGSYVYTPPHVGRNATEHTSISIVFENETEAKWEW